MFDKNLVDAVIGGKYLDCGPAELSVNLVSVNLVSVDLVLTRGVLTRGHGSLLLHQIILPGRRQTATNRLFSQNRMRASSRGGIK